MVVWLGLGKGTTQTPTQHHPLRFESSATYRYLNVVSSLLLLRIQSGPRSQELYYSMAMSSSSFGDVSPGFFFSNAREKAFPI